MATESVSIGQIRPQKQVPAEVSPRRIGFRFVVVYFALYCWFTQILTGLIPIQNIRWMPPDLSRVPPFRWLVLWTAKHVLRAATAPNYADTGSGDTLFDWVALCCLLGIAAIGTAVWTMLDRHLTAHDRIARWFRLAIRICLAGQMILYGSVKAIPLQMPFPNLYRLLEPFGNLSPMGVLWASIGASPAYQTFAGCAELLGGILLIFPRTTTLGALISLADMTQVFVLNMTYDVPVKLFSFHLILLSMVLLAPDFSRLVQFFFGNGVTGPPRDWNLFSRPKPNRLALAGQVLMGVWLIGANLYGAASGWHQYGGGSPKSELYGIWDIDQLLIDGKLREPLATDNERWRRAIFESPQRMALQRMDDSLARFDAQVSAQGRTLTLTKNEDKNWKAQFTYNRGPGDRLEADGSMDGHRIHMVLQRKDRNQFLVVSRGFHWISEVPFNR